MEQKRQKKSILEFSYFDLKEAYNLGINNGNYKDFRELVKNCQSSKEVQK